MNLIIRRRIKLFALAVLLLTCICQTGVAAESTVSIAPQTITVSQGDLFTLDIVVDPAGNEVHRAECTLRFNNTMLNANEQSGGTFLSIVTLNGINNGAGKVEYGKMNDPGASGATESGVLTSISFEALEPGTCDLTLEVSLYDSGTQLIGDVVVNSGTCIVEESTTGEPVDPVSSTTTTTTTTTTTDEHPERPSTDNTIPGFGAFCSIAGLVVASFLASKRK